MRADVDSRAESPGSAGGASCKDAVAPSAPSQGADAWGFTLIEVMIALTLSALVVLLVHRIFVGVVDGAQRLHAARTALDRDANARRLLTEMFGSLDVGTRGAGGFAGRRDRVEFTTWQRVQQGWLERRRVVLGMEGGALVARTDMAIALRDSVSGIEFDYLLEPGINAAWVREWISPVSAPVAVRVRIARRSTVDTLLFIVGPRG
jgi:prepilin-type N-terminal cleavage/methylation domain-containing protein